MSLRIWDINTKTVRGLHTWFNEIINHLGYANYSNKNWTPTITGMSGTPDVEAWYQRFGKQCNVTIFIADAHSMTSATISLPIVSVATGLVAMHNITDNTGIGGGYIDVASNVIKIEDYDLLITYKEVVIQGFYKVTGI